MKFSSLAIAASFALITAPALAATKTEALPEKPAPVATKAAAASADAGAVTGARETNPFTGKELTAEQIQLKLERAKLETQTLEEQLKQMNLSMELQNVPLRKAVEAAQARTNVQKEELAQRNLTEQARATAGAGKPAKSLKLTKEQEAEARALKEAAALRAAQTPPPVVRPTLLSVLDVAGSRSVVLDVGGSTLVVSDGDMTPLGPVRVINEGAASINGAVYKVRGNTLSRFVVSDKEVVAPTAGRPAPVAAAATPAPGQPAGASALPPLPSMLGSAGASVSGNLGIPVPGPRLVPPAVAR